MPGTTGFPFRRLSVDHLIRGETRVWWELDRQFRDPLPYTFQLQTGNTMNPNALDWVDVGSPGTNNYYAIDDERRPGDYGKTLTTNYRVKLLTSLGSYVSNPVHTFGELAEKDWVFSREIIRKESLRHRLVSVEGILLRRMRFGTRCSRCLDALTGDILDSSCQECNGVGFQVGYHPPVPLTVDMNPDAVIELLNATEPPGPSRPVDQQIRIKGFPTVAKHDVWVDGKSDQRWIFHEINNLAEWRHVPLVVQIKVSLLPFTDPVYRLSIGGEPASNTDVPNTGTGDVCIDHNYGGLDNLAYQLADGTGIVGATILVFRKTDYLNGARTSAQAVGSSGTTANGRWTTSVCLCSGDTYVIVYEKPGQYGPDTGEIVVPASSSSVSSVSSWSSSSLGPQ